MKGGITSGVVYPHAVCELAADLPAQERRRDVRRGDRGGGGRRRRVRPGDRRRSSGSRSCRTRSGRTGSSSRCSSRRASTRALFGLHARGGGARGGARAGPGAGRRAAAAVPGPGAARRAARARAPGARGGSGRRRASSWRRLAVAGRVLLGGDRCDGAVAYRGSSASRAPRSRPTTSGICSGMPGASRRARAEAPDALAGAADRRPRRARDAADTARSRSAISGPAPAATRDAADPGRAVDAARDGDHERHEPPGRAPAVGAGDFYFDGERAARPVPRADRHVADGAPAAAAGARAPSAATRSCCAGCCGRCGRCPTPPTCRCVVATRMSLSFPVLLSAVPLWRVDWSRTGERRGARGLAHVGRRDEATAWTAVDASDPDRVAPRGPDARRPRRRSAAGSPTAASRSNFPVHFFDCVPAAAPDVRRSTCGRSTRTTRRARRSARTCGWPTATARASSDWWYRFDADLGAFLGNAVRTMQNRVDEAQMRLPGYRDRVVHVSLTEREGGMNLTMEPAVIERSPTRASCAGSALVERFAQQPRGSGRALLAGPPLGPLPLLARGARRDAAGVRARLRRRRRADLPGAAARGRAADPPSSYRMTRGRSARLALS